MQLPKVVLNNATTILSGMAVAGVVGTVALAIRATPGARDKIDQEVNRKWQNADAPKIKVDESPEGEIPIKKGLSQVEVVKLVWRDYIPAAISGAATVVCILGANQIGLRKQAALVGAYTLVDTAFTSYKDEVLKVIGAKKEQEVRDSVGTKEIQDNPPVLTQVIMAGGGDQLCRDALTGRYFRGDSETIRRAENDINARIIGGDMYASLNEFFELLDLPPVRLGEILGWNTDVMLKVVLTSALSEDGIPCLAIGYLSLPKVDYDKVF